MESLATATCEACRRGAPTVTEREEAELLPQLPGWRVVEMDGERRLERVFDFADFASAMDFTNRVAGIAEEQQHHPALLTEWGRVTVTWWTHKIGGLHRNDFIMASRTDALLAPGNPT